MSPILADAINIPFVFGLGLAVLVPLMAFEIFAEAFILRSVWRLPFRHLCRFTLFANLWSLIAGIPTKILNSWLYSFFMPEDLPGFFARYPVAVGIGTLVYFAITIAVEGAYAFRWLRRNEHVIARSAVWKGILVANLATYAVLAPLHYFATRPMHQVHKFTQNTLWTQHGPTTVLFTDRMGQLKSIHADGSGPQSLVPMVVRDYLVSTNLNVILFRGGDGNLHLYRRDEAQSNLVMQTHERFQMDQAAFSPSGRRVAFAAKEGNYLEVLDVRTKQRVHQVLLPTFGGFDGPSLAWSDDEAKFYLRGFESNSPVVVAIQPDMTLNIASLESTNGIALLPCFGRVGKGGWYGSDDWGRSYNQDSCGNLQVWTEPGLGSGLRITREEQERAPILYLHVNPGLLHIARFYFGDAAFLEGGGECLFEVNGYIYLLDVQAKRVGTVARGDRFILLTDRYQKRL